MANYASLRGPVGVNRTYVRMANTPRDAAARRNAWLEGLKRGHTLATNGPLLGFTVGGQEPGGEIPLGAGEHELEYSGFMRSMVPVDHLEVVYNGDVVKAIDPGGSHKSADLRGTVLVKESGWLLLRAWNDGAHPGVFDLYPYATTTPVYVTVDGKEPVSREDAEYLLAWIERIRESAEEHADYNTEAERDAVLANLDRAERVFEERRGD